MDFSARKNIFPHSFINKGCEEKKSKFVENGHNKLEITRKIKKKGFENQNFEVFAKVVHNFGKSDDDIM